MKLHDVLLHTSAGGWGEETESDDCTKVRIIRGADFPEAALRSVKNCPVRFETTKRLPDRVCRNNDIILETSGGTSNRPTGRSVLISNDLLQQSDEPVIPASFCRLIRIDQSKASPRFIYWALQYFYLTGLPWEYQNRSTGISNFQFPRFSNDWNIPDQPYPDQVAIAEVLGALDDKIAANRKLITTTLDLVQALHDQLSGSGEVTSTLYTNVAEVGGGATPKTRVPEYWDGNIRWASPTDITALEAPYLHDTSRHITQTGLDSCSSPLYPAGSILMTSRATIGAFAVAQEPTAVNQGFIVLIPKREELRWWLLHDMTGRVKEFQNRANGATFLELSKRVFRTMEFNLPPEVQLRRFDESACALHEHAISLGQESQTLASLRDTLLPALMDGTIRVKDAETHVEEVL